MDQQDPNEDANSALKLRVQELETQCARLTRKLAKTKLNSDKVAELVDLYNKTATGTKQRPIEARTSPFSLQSTSSNPFPLDCPL